MVTNSWDHLQITEMKRGMNIWSRFWKAWLQVRNRSHPWIQCEANQSRRPWLGNLDRSNNTFEDKQSFHRWTYSSSVTTPIPRCAQSLPCLFPREHKNKSYLNVEDYYCSSSTVINTPWLPIPFKFYCMFYRATVAQMTGQTITAASRIGKEISNCKADYRTT